MAEKGEDVDVLKKAIKELLFKIVPYEEAIGYKVAMAKGRAIKFEKIKMKDEWGDAYIQYQLLVEFDPFQRLGGPMKDSEFVELQDLLVKIQKEKLAPDQQRRIEHLKNKKIAHFKFKDWMQFMKNLGMREVKVEYSLDDE